jgi:hypothetical protein
LSYRASFSSALELLGRSVRGVSVFMPGPEIQEAQNKLEAFRLFAYVDQALRFGTGRLSLTSMMVRARYLSSWQRIFALEGIAHYHTSAVRAPNALLADPALPETAMVSMHAGMGTAFAGAALSRLGSAPSNADVRGALDGFFELCHANSRSGWHENAIEPMGLVVRTLYPNLLMQVNREIGKIDPEAQRLFWHGVGRSLYFVPMNFLPLGGAHERALHAAIAEAPTFEDRHNTLAGLTWALTLVNILHPGVLESFLRTCRTVAGRGDMMPAAVTNGIASALMVWKHMVPEAPESLTPYLKYASPRVPYSQVWKDFVAVPTAHAFAEVFPALTAPDAQGRATVASLFRYRDMRVNPT